MTKYSFHVRVPFSGELSDKDIEGLTVLCDGLLKRPKDGQTSTSALPSLAIYFDEVTDFSDPSVIPPALRRLIRKGRKRGVTVIVATQRPQGLNKWFLNNSQHRVYYYISDYDAKHIRDYAPFLADHLNEIPYGSYKSIYQAPDGTLMILGPIGEYDWSKRK